MVTPRCGFGVAVARCGKELRRPRRKSELEIEQVVRNTSRVAEANRTLLTQLIELSSPLLLSLEKDVSFNISRQPRRNLGRATAIREFPIPQALMPSLSLCSLA